MFDPTEYIVVGRVRGAHGIRGEFFVALKAGRADWLSQLKDFQLQPEDGGIADSRWPMRLKVASCRFHKGGLILRPEGFLDRNQAEKVKGSLFSIPRSYITGDLESGIYLGQLLGFQVLSVDGDILGRVRGFKSNGPQDLLEVETPIGIGLVPLVREIWIATDLLAKTLTLNLPEGLLEATAERGESTS